MKETPEERGKIIKKVWGCRFCTHLRHTSEQSQCPSMYSQEEEAATEDRSGQASAVYSVQACAPFNTTESCVLVIKDTFVKGLSLPSRPLTLNLKVLGNKMINQDAREYSLILKDNSSGIRKHRRSQANTKHQTLLALVPKQKQIHKKGAR